MKWIILAIIFVYGFPLWQLRYKFRSAVYNDTSWKINFRPWFLKETLSLFSNRYFEKSEYRMANSYRLYLLIYALLWAVFFWY